MIMENDIVNQLPPVFWETIRNRMAELKESPEFREQAKDCKSPEEVRDMLWKTAIWTLMYSPEERERIIKERAEKS